LPLLLGNHLVVEHELVVRRIETSLHQHIAVRQFDMLLRHPAEAPVPRLHGVPDRAPAGRREHVARVVYFVLRAARLEGELPYARPSGRRKAIPERLLLILVPRGKRGSLDLDEDRLREGNAHRRLRSGMTLLAGLPTFRKSDSICSARESADPS